MIRKTETKEGLFEGPRPQEGCLSCWGKKNKSGKTMYGIYTSQPVNLALGGGKYVQLCYVAKCVECGAVKYYGGITPGIYKLNDKVADFGISYWPEVKKYHISPDKLVDKILRVGPHPTYVNLHEVQYANQNM